MIFMDAQPIEPGWYWGINKTYGKIPRPYILFGNKFDKTLSVNIEDDIYDTDPTSYLWGDKMELPIVELPIVELDSQEPIIRDIKPDIQELQDLQDL